MGVNNWATPLNLVKEVKRTYFEFFGNYGDYQFETWVEVLRGLCPKFSFLKILDPLQVNQDGDLILIRFGLAEMQDQGGEMWSNENSIYRECRSIVIDIRREEVVIAPFRKFFNLNEVEENTLDNIVKEIGQAKSVEFANKLDGSMQCATMYKDDILLTGSMALTPKSSWRLEEGYKMLTDSHKIMIQDHPFITFIFEFISLRDPHVVIYNKEQEGLYLIGMRNKNNGKQYSYKEIKLFSDAYNVPMTKIEDISLEQVLEMSKTEESCNKEGWVLNIDGHMVKVKCDDYVRLHRCLDSVSSINVIIKAVADETYDDLISKIPSGYRERIQVVADKLFTYVADTNREVYKHLEKVKHIEDRTKAMKAITVEVPQIYQSYVRNAYDKYPFSPLRTRLRYKKFNELGLGEDISDLFLIEEE